MSTKTTSKARIPRDGSPRSLDLRLQLSEEEREKIRQDIIAGAKEMNDLYLEETKAWYPLEEEVRLKFEVGLYDETFVRENPSA